MTVGNQRPRTRKRRRAEHLGSELRRPQVIDAALAIAAAHGIRRVTMEGVAEALHVTKPVVYACFPTREELVSALLEREEARLVQGVMSALPAVVDEHDLDATFARGFAALLAVVAEHPSSWELVVAPQPDPAVAARYGRARALIAARVGDLMERGLTRAGKDDVARKLPVLVELFMASGDAAVRSFRHGGWTPSELGAFIGRITLCALRCA